MLLCMRFACRLCVKGLSEVRVKTVADVMMNWLMVDE